MEKANGKGQVRFTLSSHPDQIRTALLQRMAQQAVPELGKSTGSERRIVRVQAILPSSALPIRKDGAVARAAIDCGRVPAIWLATRDAYQAVAAWVKMLW